MNTIVKVVILLLLVAVIFGTTAWYTYDLYLKPHKVAKPRSVATKVALAPADSSKAEYDAIVAAPKTQPRGETIAALQKFLTDYPTSANVADARKWLGTLNLEEFFSHTPGPNKTEYTVVPGDSLARIASKNKVSFDLIIRANNIDRLLIHPGDKFTIPTGNFSIEISGKTKTVTLRDNGAFFKEYATLSVNLPTSGAPENLQVSEKIAWHDGKRVAFGDKNYVGSSRWISLSSGGLTLYSVVEDGSAPDIESPGSGAKLAPEDIEEIFALVNRGTPVTIVP